MPLVKERDQFLRHKFNSDDSWSKASPGIYFWPSGQFKKLISKVVKIWKFKDLYLSSKFQTLTALEFGFIVQEHSWLEMIKCHIYNLSSLPYPQTLTLLSWLFRCSVNAKSFHSCAFSWLTCFYPEVILWASTQIPPCSQSINQTTTVLSINGRSNFTLSLKQNSN